MLWNLYKRLMTKIPELMTLQMVTAAMVVNGNFGDDQFAAVTGVLLLNGVLHWIMRVIPAK